MLTQLKAQVPPPAYQTDNYRPVELSYGARINVSLIVQTLNIENQMNHLFYPNQFFLLVPTNEPTMYSFFFSFLFRVFNFQNCTVPLCSLMQTLGRKHSRVSPLSSWCLSYTLTLCFYYHLIHFCKTTD